VETLTDSTEGCLYRFLEEYGDNREKSQLLRFWGTYPNARFTRYAICYGLDWSKLGANRALKALVDAGVVDTHSHNGLTFYSLTENEEKRRPVVELAALGWDQWQRMLKRIEIK
jgi:hypothetical protein